MVLVCLLLGVGLFYYWRKCRPGTPYIPWQPGAVFPDRAKHPDILRDDTREKSMVAQRQDTVRLPYGPPNAYQRTIGFPPMLANPHYQKEYQKIMRECQIDTVDWRVDPKFNSPLNNTPGSQHIPENMIGSISKWSYE